MNVTFKKLLSISVVACCLFSATQASAFERPQIAGLHLGTVHSTSGFCSNTPGAYAKWGDGFTVGVYKNSECEKYSFYIGKTWQTEGSVRFAVTAGVITGYKRALVLPLIAPSVSIDVAHGFALRMTYVPKFEAKGAHALNFALEKSF